MRFSHIRLAGFKSFADTATIPVSGRMTGVVGPNGCGKSNVVDAIRWVMGERSASALRGEDMHDVIFNGASSRAPMDRASVELHFHTVALPADSPWSAFHELNIRRVIYRNQTSDYFINNQKVRRRDVADLFLGTGLGPRSYAIIEQGMVSRIIESNPKELKVYLEEAAGVSKYKERRTETEHRMEDVRANLLRIEDIRVEVAHGVDKLYAQAQTARQYQTLQQAYLADSRLMAMLSWFSAMEERQKTSEKMDTEQVALTQTASAMAEIDRQTAEFDNAWQSAQNALEDAQSNLTALSAQIFEIEQELRLGAQKREHLEQARQKLINRRETLLDNARRIDDDINRHTLEYEDCQAKRVNAEATAQELLAQFYESEKHLMEARTQQDKTRDEHTRITHQLEALQRQLQIMRERWRDIETQKEAIAQADEALPDDKVLDGEHASAAIYPHQGTLTALIDNLAVRKEERESLIEERQLAEQDFLTHNEELSRLRQKESALRAQLNTLERQLAASARHQERLPQWLQEQGLLPSQPLEEVLNLSGEWKHALAIVLSDWLSARHVPLLPEGESSPPPGRLIFNHEAPNAVESPSMAARPGTLAELIRVDDPGFSAWLLPFLNHYRLCDDWRWAIAHREQLASDECFVSQDGIIVAAHSAVFAGDGGERAIHLENRLAHESTLVALRDLGERLQNALSAMEKSERTKERLIRAVNEITAQIQRDEQSRERLEKEEQAWAFEQQSEQEKIQWQRREWALQSKALTEEAVKWQTQMVQLGEESTRLEAQKQEVAQSLVSAQTTLTEWEHKARAAREAQRDGELLAQKCEHQCEVAKREINRAVEQRDTNALSIEETDEQLAQTQEEWAQINEAEAGDATLQDLLTQKKNQEQEVGTLRLALETQHSERKQSSADRLRLERQTEQIRARLENHRLHLQEIDLRAQQYREHYVKHGGEWTQLAQTPAEQGVDTSRSMAQLQESINDGEAQMKALEPVNLASIVDYERESARLTELQNQQTDLTTALETLQTAIARIDQETRARMLDVFAQVNEKFGALFKTIFGGGHAAIILTGEEILDAGVLLKAQPLGKNNASIHLLSGGEKALTAIALVFAFFSLNPAPFCVLDEVDAPLDDANTRRFTELIRDMSGETQFLVISHNRITMEAMDTLVGVTMRNPGLSKVVSVDLLNALAPSTMGHDALAQES